MNLHPVFHQALAHAMPQPSREDAYVAALKRFDWAFYSYCEHGRADLEFLRREQKIVDPDGSLWRQHGDEAFLRMDK